MAQKQKAACGAPNKARMWHILPSRHHLLTQWKAWFRHTVILVTDELESSSVVLKPICHFSFNI